MKYIKTGKIQKLIDQADKDGRPLFISGPIGSGKTAAVEYYYRRVAHLTIHCADGYIEQRVNPSSLRQRVIIFDNISYLADEDSKKYVLNMLNNSDKHIIFTSRAPRPSWLMAKLTDKNVVLADLKDLRLSKDQVFRLLEEAGVNASQEEMLKVLEDSRSNPLVLWCLAYYMKDTGEYTKEVNTFGRISYHNYLDNELLGRLTAQESDFLLAMSWYPNFTFDLARTLNNGLDCRPLVDSIQKKNAYILTFSSAGVQLMDQNIDYLRHKRSIQWSDEKNRENLCAAAEYYQQINNTRAALICYQNANEEEKFLSLLEKSAEENINAESVTGLIDFYSVLEPEKIQNSWPLVSALSMKESLLVKPKKAEFWFDRLKELYEAEDDQEVKEKIYKRIVFLDLILPHHGNKNICERFNNAIKTFRVQANVMPREYIDMMPTAIHGALDFCEISKNENELFEMCEGMTRALKGKTSDGFIDILKGELAYEKDKQDDFWIQRHLERGYTKADSDDSFAGCFAAIGVSVHQHLFNGNLERAEELLESIRKKAVNAKNDFLLNNIDALYSWVDQLHANKENVLAWLETAPDEGQQITFLERSIMLCKVRAYIILGRFDAALGLIERLLTFFEMYDRVYAYYEALLYKAITLYRMKCPDYEQVITEVIEKACDLGFYHIIADHGIAVKPLLESVRPDLPDRDFYDHLIRLTRQMAENYPNYMHTLQDLAEPLTKTESRVLHLLCEGLNADEICEIMEITYSGIKFHNKNIYRKLGVSNRTEAVRKAFMLGLSEFKSHC